MGLVLSTDGVYGLILCGCLSKLEGPGKPFYAVLNFRGVPFYVVLDLRNVPFIRCSGSPGCSFLRCSDSPGVRFYVVLDLR